MHLYAAFQMCITQRFHCCQGNLIPFCFSLVHQLLRDCADEAHVDSEAEAKLMVLCIVSIERRRLALASQVLASRGSAVFKVLWRLRRSVVSTNRLRYHVRVQDDSMAALVSENSLMR